MLVRHFYHLLVSVILGCLSVAGFLGVADQAQAAVIPNPPDSAAVYEQTLTTTQQVIYLPLSMKYSPWLNPFGAEAGALLVRGSEVYSSTVNLPAKWVRLNARVSWRFLQPEEGGAIDWPQLANFETELRHLKEVGITPIVIIDDYPRWATDNTVRWDGLPTSCGRLLEDKVDDFAIFVTAIVNRYKTAEFNVRNWELGNEPDVDPNMVKPDNVFGCWGDIDDPYYGGERYGRMIIAVSTAIKAADPTAQVWIGGLLLDKPEETDLLKGHPELFFEGILRSGAAPYFDVVPYHVYPGYGWQTVRDFDLLPPTWFDWGGATVGKARYLRQVMQAYGVSKPVFLNETSFICAYDPKYPNNYPWCETPGDDFYDLQANLAVRMATRAYSENVMGLIWYTIDGPGWRWGSLLDGDQSPRPAYSAYSYLINQYRNSRVLGRVSYETGIEAYAFDRGTERLDVLWSIYDETITATIPAADWLGAYGREGETITPTLSGSSYLLPVGFSPIYVHRRP